MIREFFLAKGSDLGIEMVVARSVVGLIVAIVLVRIGKKRFIAQASAMDLVVVVMFGSILSRSVNGGANFLSGLVACLVLSLMQRFFSKLGYLSPRFERMVKGGTYVLVRDGKPDKEAMSQHDITETDLRQDMRLRALFDDLSKVRVAVLERSGQISIVKADES